MGTRVAGVKHTTKDNRNETDKYLSMPYKRIVYPTGESGNAAFFAEVLEFGSCYAEGATAAAALSNLDDSIRAYVSTALKAGIEIPCPIAASKSSGKVLVRMSPDLHAKLAIKAKQSGVSLNHCIVTSIVAGMQSI